MSDTPTATAKRLNNAYVQVPASPLALSSYRALRTPLHVAASSKLKENTPLRPFQSAMSQHKSASASNKRKMSDRDPSSLVFSGIVISSKKSKLSNGHSGVLKSLEMPPIAALDNSSNEYPNGFTYCHQCSKKRDIKDTLRCTVVEHYQTTKSKTIKERLCVNKYCKPCLRNRYGEDIDALKSQVHGNVIGFQCPRCRDICNCPRCRKSKGLDPIGVIAKETLNPSETLPKKKVDEKSNPPKNVKEVAKSKTRILPKLNWTPVPTKLTQEEADERIFIREFILRFWYFLDPVVAKTHVEELELIGGRPPKRDEETYVTGWVSDMCIKALTMSLLGIVAKEAELDIGRIIKAVLKDMRSAGPNLNKIWNLLASLRSQVSDAFTQDTSTAGSKTPYLIPFDHLFDDPGSPPSVASARKSLRQSDSGMHIVHSTQMIPVLVSLIHSVLKTATIRNEIDSGGSNTKDYSLDAKEALRLENERWEKERDTITSAKNKVQRGENKAKRILHKAQITNIENSMAIIASSFLPRFMTLGTDAAGREYYALSPGYAESETAVEYLERAANEKPAKAKKKAHVLNTEERSGLQEWSWFVAVWGKKPDEGGASKSTEGNTEKWWGFWEPEEISKLAEWISIESGFDDEADPTASGSGGSAPTKEKAPLPPRTAQLRRLITGLKDYSSLLEWRMREDKCQLVPKRSADL